MRKPSSHSPRPSSRARAMKSSHSRPGRAGSPVDSWWLIRLFAARNSVLTSPAARAAVIAVSQSARRRRAGRRRSARCRAGTAARGDVDPGAHAQAPGPPPVARTPSARSVSTKIGTRERLDQQPHLDVAAGAATSSSPSSSSGAARRCRRRSRRRGRAAGRPRRCAVAVVRVDQVEHARTMPSQSWASSRACAARSRSSSASGPGRAVAAATPGARPARRAGRCSRRRASRRRRRGSRSPPSCEVPGGLAVVGDDAGERAVQLGQSRPGRADRRSPRRAVRAALRCRWATRDDEVGVEQALHPGLVEFVRRSSAGRRARACAKVSRPTASSLRSRAAIARRRLAVGSPRRGQLAQQQRIAAGPVDHAAHRGSRRSGRSERTTVAGVLGVERCERHLDEAGVAQPVEHRAAPRSRRAARPASRPTRPASRVDHLEAWRRRPTAGRRARARRCRSSRSTSAATAVGSASPIGRARAPARAAGTASTTASTGHRPRRTRRPLAAATARKQRRSCRSRPRRPRRPARSSASRRASSAELDVPADDGSHHDLDHRKNDNSPPPLGRRAVELWYAARSAAHDLAGLQAGRAHGDPTAGAGRDERAHLLHVRVPPAVGAAVGVRDGHAEAGPLAADIADAGHNGLLGRADQ